MKQILNEDEADVLFAKDINVKNRISEEYTTYMFIKRIEEYIPGQMIFTYIYQVNLHMFAYYEISFGDGRNFEKGEYKWNDFTYISKSIVEVIASKYDRLLNS